MRSTPARISPATYPIAATATAPAYEYNSQPETAVAPQAPERASMAAGQQALFSTPAFDPRIIPFDSLTTQAERESIRARAAELARPAPLKTEKIEAPRVRARRSQSTDQRRLDFMSHDQALPLPQSSIICDAPVAPLALRMQAAVIDGLLMALGCGFGVALFEALGGQLSLDRHAIPFFALAILTVPLFYKLLWTLAGRDTAGMRKAGLQLVDFDGNRPSKARRYQRLCGTFLSFAAAGIGMVWALVDEDGLTWHDHISSTFPTIVSED
ncbi:MAG TPA: RDD family protein [Bryobacteraceae bacterium]|nr:RDD family protein [Bryobacteraceae bacterium]